MYKIEEIKDISWLNQLGEHLLIRTLSNAYLMMTKSPILYQTKGIKEAKEDFAFIQNDSGIHKIITTFGLYYNPDTLQNNFFYCMHIA